MEMTKSEQCPRQTISHLPTDTTTNISSTLPLQDLNNNNLNYLIVNRTHNNCSNLYTILHRADRLETSLKLNSIGFPRPPRTFRIVGSSNGHVCLASTAFNYRFFYICNPLTSKTYKFPKPPSLMNSSHIEPTSGSRDWLPCGFAFDKTINAYKVVCVISSSTLCNGCKTEIEISSFGATGKSTWRRLQDHPSFVSRDTSSTNSMVLLNGALHWWANYITDSEFAFRHSGVVVLDVADESFKLLWTPLGGACTTLGVLDDCLCVCGEHKDGCKIWVMKDYGDESSWTLDYSFQKEIMGPLHDLDCVNVVRRMSNGSVLLHCGEDQGYYDSETGEFKKIVFNGIPPSADYMEIISHSANGVAPTWC